MCEKSTRSVMGEVRVGGQLLVRKWSECVMEDMNLLGVEEHVVQDDGCGKQSWPIQILHLDGKIWRLNENDDDDDDDDEP